jgi:hypothetical protein
VTADLPPLDAWRPDRLLAAAEAAHAVDLANTLPTTTTPDTEGENR